MSTHSPSSANAKNRTYNLHAVHSMTCAEESARFEQHIHLRYQVVLAGNSFFHITETATGRVRGFRINHNEACTLARNLEVSH